MVLGGFPPTRGPRWVVWLGSRIELNAEPSDQGGGFGCDQPTNQPPQPPRAPHSHTPHAAHSRTVRRSKKGKQPIHTCAMTRAPTSPFDKELYIAVLENVRLDGLNAGSATRLSQTPPKQSPPAPQSRQKPPRTCGSLSTKAKSETQPCLSTGLSTLHHRADHIYSHARVADTRARKIRTPHTCSIELTHSQHRSHSSHTQSRA